MKPERTLPKFEPPTAGLAFSQNPTTQEIFHFRAFAEPLVPVGGEPGVAENSALASALTSYAKREGPDDFLSLTGFLETHPQSPWRVALLTDLGLEYYHTAHYSLALDAWEEAWSLAKNVTDAKGKAIADRAFGELVAMRARVGQMTELEDLLKSVEGRPFSGPATERVANARGGLAEMKERPEISFRCGPLALFRIVLATQPERAREVAPVIHASASTRRGFSLRQVAELSQKIGLNYRMAYREKGAEFIVPSVLHWKVGHYAALIRQEGDRYLLQDPTFRNDVWATRAALEAEASGYCVVPDGGLPRGWRSVEPSEGDTVWGKGNVGGPDPGGGGAGSPPPCQGMAVSTVDLLFVSLTLVDNPVGYSPPTGPAVRFTFHYNQRDPAQPAVFSYSNLGPKWTLDWVSYITDNPMNTNADVEYYRMGGFVRDFTGFDPKTQAYSFQLYDDTLLRRTSPNSYEMLAADGLKLVFSQSDGSSGTSRKVFLTQIVDPIGNAVALSYDAQMRLVAVTDAIGQVTTLSYDNPSDDLKITKVTDPFGRLATFDYDASGHLAKITDVIGLTSEFSYDPGSDFINALTTPYGLTSFVKGESGTTRSLETTYPDGTKERVEFNESTTLGISEFAPANQVPNGMQTFNDYMYFRNTYYWSRNTYANTYPDYTKARIYHWLHTPDLASASAVLESTKEPLENRVWFDYVGQSSPIIVGTNSRPAHIGRVLDDGRTQLHTFAFDGFGHLTNSIDPVGRTFSYLYDTNGIDLLEIRQTRSRNKELLFKATYNSQHRPLTRMGASGQTTAYSYNTRQQMLTVTDSRNETITCTYDANGNLVAADSPLPGTSDSLTATYGAFGGIRTLTDMSGYSWTFDYDALNRVTRITYPDATFRQYTYDRLDLAGILDRAGRQTSFEHDNMRQMTKKTDALGRATFTEWCRCGAIKSLTDPMGRTTLWLTDLQGRRIAKQYADGSQIQYVYENTTSRLRQVIDQKQQVATYTYNLDNTRQSVVYTNEAVTTPTVSYTYDADYERVTSMTDGIGTTTYSYVPITASPVLGAGRLASENGPLANETVNYGYDELGRLVRTSINGVDSTRTFDAAGRIASESNALGSFTYGYDGNSTRVVSQSYPNGETAAMSYGSDLQNFALQQISYTEGATPISQFDYISDILTGQLTSWSLQAGSGTPSVYTLDYDAAGQLVTAMVTNAGANVGSFAYSYDPAGNRQLETVSGATSQTTYNTLNEINTIDNTTNLRTNEWDAENRLTAVNAGNQRAELAYDGHGRLSSIRLLLNGSEVSLRRFVWSGRQISEERDASGGNVTKRFFTQGVILETGTAAGSYFYTRDHLGSIREMCDSSGIVRARYDYDPFGRQTKVAGDVDADFGFCGMFLASEAAVAVTRFRAYDPALGRWLSRDPLEDAEVKEGPNLYAYAGNDPVNNVDLEGLCLTTVECTCLRQPAVCEAAGMAARGAAAAGAAAKTLQGLGFPEVASDVGETAVAEVENGVQACVESPVFQVARSGVDKVMNVVRMPDGELLYVSGNRAGTLMSDETATALENLAENGDWADMWWLAELAATRDYRTMLAGDGPALAFRAISLKYNEILRALNLGF